MKFDKQTGDAGVSPVVGVILMVAITVILSAIIATFVLDLGGTVSQNPQAGVTFDQDLAPADHDADGTVEKQATIQVVSMENADSVSVSVSNNAGDSDPSGGQIVGSDSSTDVGDSLTLGGSGAAAELEAGDKLTVTATLEGKTSVIQTYTVE